jgi:hypothetical protein
MNVLNLRQTALALLRRLDWAPPLLARLVIGVIFVPTGWGKLHNLPDIVASPREIFGKEELHYIALLAYLVVSGPGGRCRSTPSSRAGSTLRAHTPGRRCARPALEGHGGARSPPQPVGRRKNDARRVTQHPLTRRKRRHTPCCLESLLAAGEPAGRAVGRCHPCSGSSRASASRASSA